MSLAYYKIFYVLAAAVYQSIIQIGLLWSWKGQYEMGTENWELQISVPPEVQRCLCPRCNIFILILFHLSRLLLPLWSAGFGKKTTSLDALFSWAPASCYGLYPPGCTLCNNRRFWIELFSAWTTLKFAVDSLYTQIPADWTSFARAQQNKMQTDLQICSASLWRFCLAFLVKNFPIQPYHVTWANSFSFPTR